ncbi:MAG TPA: cupredoxin family protein [Noviherbaspirillum sp.]|uniref:cupredoxin domain-containing protein n=1 Tax=Noviherbaspirillum sp. TaxID=1926288 RepID=UPI002D6B4055|nr:cupredoxin family protein [Noviherbaspirillum sp.]HYD96481.1 cupredoxin family protein [Noviherbaspirillum sp.]
MTQTNTVAAVISPVVIAFSFASTNALAVAGSHGQGTSHNAAHAPEADMFGKPGNARKVSRTLPVEMTDDMRFGPAAVSVKQGETIRFVVTNKGKLLHEMVLGTMDELKAHGKAMSQQRQLRHDDPSSAHVEPGQKGDIVWQFTKAGDFYFACLIPGHFEAGMFGKIKVLKG